MNSQLSQDSVSYEMHVSQTHAGHSYVPGGLAAQIGPQSSTSNPAHLWPSTDSH